MEIKKLKEINVIPSGEKDEFGDYKVPKELWEKTFPGKKDPTKTYTICEVSVIPADSSPELAGEFIKMTFWPYVDKKTNVVKTTALDEAKRWVAENKGKDVILKIETETYPKKDGTTGTKYTAKIPSKKEKEVAMQFIK